MGDHLRQNLDHGSSPLASPSTFSEENQSDDDHTDSNYFNRPSCMLLENQAQPTSPPDRNDPTEWFQFRSRWTEFLESTSTPMDDLEEGQEDFDNDEPCSLSPISQCSSIGDIGPDLDDSPQFQPPPCNCCCCRRECQQISPPPPLPSLPPEVDAPATNFSAQIWLQTNQNGGNNHNNLEKTPNDPRCTYLVCNFRGSPQSNSVNHVLPNFDPNGARKQLKCDRCLYVYSTFGASDLLKHMTLHDLNNGGNARGSYKCVGCPYQTTNYRSFRRHLKMNGARNK